MYKLNLSIASTDYDHFSDFRSGAVRAAGIDHTWSILGHHEVFSRFTANWEWDVVELRFYKFSVQITRDDFDIFGLPVVYSRLFRLPAFYVNKNAAVKTVEDLKGKRFGSPKWAHSAAVYMRDACKLCLATTRSRLGSRKTELPWNRCFSITNRMASFTNTQAGRHFSAGCHD